MEVNRKKCQIVQKGLLRKFMCGIYEIFHFFLLKNFLDEKLFDWAEKKFLKNF